MSTNKTSQAVQKYLRRVGTARMEGMSVTYMPDTEELHAIVLHYQNMEEALESIMRIGEDKTKPMKLQQMYRIAETALSFDPLSS